MKATIKVSKSLIIELEAETQKELFKEIASAHEVFGEEKCSLCENTELAPVFRTVNSGKKSFTYAEWHCKKCRARLSMGTLNEGGGLFPVRKLEKDGKPNSKEGEYGKHQGWTQFKGKVEVETE